MALLHPKLSTIPTCPAVTHCGTKMHQCFSQSPRAFPNAHRTVVPTNSRPAATYFGCQHGRVLARGPVGVNLTSRLAAVRP
jgi:hypothetical protein